MFNFLIVELQNAMCRVTFSQLLYIPCKTGKNMIRYPPFHLLSYRKITYLSPKKLSPNSLFTCTLPSSEDSSLPSLPGNPKLCCKYSAGKLSLLTEFTSPLGVKLLVAGCTHEPPTPSPPSNSWLPTWFWPCPFCPGTNNGGIVLMLLPFGVPF